MATFTWRPDYGATNEVKPKVFRVDFGDGYEQRIANGINTKPRMWSLVFTKTKANIDDIEAFLEDRGAVESFDWTPPRGSAGKWICDSWKRGIPNAGYDTLTASFREVFGE